MSVITITSEWTNFDYYLGAVKGKLLSLCNNVKIVDINHSIQPYDILSGAFVLKAAYHCFPEKSVHLVCISSNFSKYPVVIVSHNSHFFIGTDNGFFNLLFENQPFEMIEVDNPFPDSTFIELDLYPQLATALYKNCLCFNSLGKKRGSLNLLSPNLPSFQDSCIKGTVLFIDSYGNAITNIHKEDYYKYFNNDSSIVFIDNKYNSTIKIRKTYSDVPLGEIIALFNSLNLLEVAINNGNISELLGLKRGSLVIVAAYNNNKKHDMELEYKEKDNIRQRLSGAYGYN